MSSKVSIRSLKVEVRKIFEIPGSTFHSKTSWMLNNYDTWISYEEVYSVLGTTVDKYWVMTPKMFLLFLSRKKNVTYSFNFWKIKRILNRTSIIVMQIFAAAAAQLWLSMTRSKICLTNSIRVRAPSKFGSENHETLCFNNQFNLIPATQPDS